jgi:hypothetical protein
MKMNKNRFKLLIMLLVASMFFYACSAPETAEPEPTDAPEAEVEETEAEEPAAPEEEAEASSTEGIKIAFFVSDLSNVFHQAQFAEAQRYAM